MALSVSRTLVMPSIMMGLRYTMSVWVRCSHLYQVLSYDVPVDVFWREWTDIGS